MIDNFGVGGSTPLTCLGHVSLLGINGFGAVLCGVGRRESRPRSIIASLDGAHPGGIYREAR